MDILVKNSHLTSAKFKTARLINDKYVARAVNSGSLQLSDVGKDVPGDLKPLGYRIYIDTIENVVSKLKKLEG